MTRSEILQPQLGAVRQVAQLERAGEHADDVGPLAQHLGERPADVAGPRASAPKIRYASSFISASVPSRWTAMTPLRMLLTMWRKKRSSAACRRTGAAARRAAGPRGGPARGRARRDAEACRAWSRALMSSTAQGQTTCPRLDAAEWPKNRVNSVGYGDAQLEAL